jgi:MoaA/NifB/PqqE/SkfB family radical SAM enzyme
MLGEPFLNKNLANYIRAAKSIGYSYVYETTNGALATPDKLRDVFSAGLDSVKFSINASTRESYLSTHGKDDFEIVKKHIAYCREYRENSGKRFNIFVSYVATSQTIDDAKQFKNEFSNYADSVAFYAATARSGVASGNQLPINRDENRSCMQPFNAICVSCEGILTPCCIDPHLELAMDDLHNISLKDAWYSSKMTKFRQMHIDKKLDGSHCEKCLRDGSNWLQLLDL